MSECQGGVYNVGEALVIGAFLVLCELLIHPGLFWAFSGRNAVRLAQVR